MEVQEDSLTQQGLYLWACSGADLFQARPAVPDDDAFLGIALDEEIHVNLEFRAFGGVRGGGHQFLDLDGQRVGQFLVQDFQGGFAHVFRDHHLGFLVGG